MAQQASRPRRVVWIIGQEHWERAELRAELIERGYDADGFAGMQDALAALRVPARPRPAAVLIDLRGLLYTAQELAALQRLGVPLLALAGAGEGTGGQWTAVLRRPLTVGQTVDAVAAHVDRGT
jgi:hypothetical protein